MKRSGGVTVNNFKYINKITTFTQTKYETISIIIM